MKKNLTLNWRPSDILFSLIVLAFLFIFTYGLLFVAPYPGFYFNPSDGVVAAIYRPESSNPSLAIGDVIEHVNQTSLVAYNKDKKLNLFAGIQKGQTIEIGIRRENEQLTIPWVYPGFNRPEFLGRFLNIWWLAYVFWFVGMAAQLLIRPKDTQRRLFVASNYLTAIFLMVGSVSSYRVMMSAILLRIVAWLLLPVYLHFHWIFPTSVRLIPKFLKISFYILVGVIAFAQFLQLVPSSLYFIAVAFAFGGSLVLLLLHYIYQPEHRPELRFLGAAACLALLPTILISVVASSGRIPSVGPLSLLALPVLPGAYFYILFRRSLGGLELRTNRAISLYLFFVVLGVLLMLVVGDTGLMTIPVEAFLFATILIALVSTFVGVLVFPRFQEFVERRLLGVKLPAQTMIESYSARIVTSNTLSGLLRLLEDEVFPSLLIRQYAFVQVTNSSAKVLLAQDADLDSISEQALLDLLASSSTGERLSAATENQPFGWVRLALSLRVGSEWIGAWLLGRRDPDDHYPQAELPILQSLADQTAIALSNILQTARLKLMYDANIDRYEQERQRLGRDLHDSVLNEMGAMLMKQDPADLTPSFQESFNTLIVRLREIVTDLRPPMLIYGLKSALDSLADNLSERNHDVVQVISEVQATDTCRYPENVEHNVYRIMQEACENALKYAQAKAICIRGELTPAKIDLHVVDDGIGFKDDVGMLLDEMVANKHYGLAGMHERAELIGATIRIVSKPDQGTQIHLLWEAKAT